MQQPSPGPGQPSLLRAATVALILALILTGCGGYALVGRGTTLPDDVRAVFLQPLDNETRRGELDQILTQALATELVTRQRFSLTSSVGEADATLKGAVTGFRLTPVTFDSQGRGDEYEVAITVRMAFVRNDEDETQLWASDRYQFRQTYPLGGGDPTDFFSLENTAIELSAGDFAESMVIDILEGF